MPFASPDLGPLLVSLAAVSLVWALARLGVLSWAAERPLTVLVIGGAAGVLVRQLGAPPAEADLVREAARLGLAVLVFGASQQARLSRLAVLSPAALRLSILAVPLFAAASAAAVFALLPGMGPWPALLCASSFALGGATFEERRAMAAPLPAEVKRTLRLDAAIGLVIGVPLAVLAEVAATPPGGGAGLGEAPAFGAFAGTALGGAVGLLAGRLIPVRDAAIPRAPLLALALAYVVTRALGYDVVLAALACGVLYSEESGLLGPVRSRLYSVSLRWCAPAAFFGLGALTAPVLLQLDLLAALAALVPLLVLRPVLRGAALGGVPLKPHERSFLAGFGGVPGAGAALFVLSLLGSPAPAAQAEAVTIAATGVFAGLVLARLASAPLVTRQVRTEARLRKRRYGTA